MRKITEESVRAFFNAEKFNKSNMQVEVLPNVTILKYHGNSIAFRYNGIKKTILIQNCGWETDTTRERLNGVIIAAGFDYVIKQRNFIWYLDGKEWNGDLTELN